MTEAQEAVNALKGKGWKLEDIASNLGVTYGTVAAWQRGKPGHGGNLRRLRDLAETASAK